MEIQQHDDVVVDAAGCRHGFAELIRERERCCRGGGRRPRLCSYCPPSPLYIGPLGGRRPWRSHLPRGQRPRGWSTPQGKWGAPPP